MHTLVWRVDDIGVRVVADSSLFDVSGCHDDH